MKRFWMIWVTAMTSIIVLVGGYSIVHRHNTVKYCAISAQKKADKDNPIFPTGFGSSANKNEYDKLYSFCMRTSSY